MLEPTELTWVLSIVGLVIYIPPVYLEVLAVWKPDSQRTKDLLVGKGDDYKDETHAAFCYGHGWADMAIPIPAVIAGCIGVLLGQPWGYMLWFAGAAITIYIHFILLFLEGKHIYRTWGRLAFFTYAWGLWVYWAVAVAVYSLVRIQATAAAGP